MEGESVYKKEQVHHEKRPAGVAEDSFSGDCEFFYKLC